MKYLGDIGVRTRIFQTTRTAVSRKWNDRTFYCMHMWASSQNVDPMSTMLERLAKYNGINAWHGPSPRAEELANQIQQEFDVNKRVRLVKEVINTIWQEAWVVPLCEVVNISVISNKWEWQKPAAAQGIEVTKVKPRGR